MPNISDGYQIALAKELRPLIRRIVRALTKRPEPEEPDAFDFEVEMLAEGLPEAIIPALESLVESLPALLDEHPWLPPEEDADEAVARVTEGVDSLLETLHSVWERSFPYGMEDGQQVLSAMAERPLREVLGGLQDLVAAIEDSQGTDDDREEVSIAMTFDLEAEADAVARWMERQGWRGAKTGSSWTSLAAAFLLGRWTGK